MDVVLATLNENKVREFQFYLADLNIKIKPQSDFNVQEAVETGTTFVENAIIKARSAAYATGLPAIADDSGLVVEALHGAPGVYSSRYAGAKATDSMNIEKLLHDLQGVAESERNAFFYCVIVFMRHHDDPIPIICEGKWSGRILHKQQGQHGFGYDPIFYDDREQKSAAELTLAQKNKISHRGQALQCLVQELR